MSVGECVVLGVWAAWVGHYFYTTWVEFKRFLDDEERWKRFLDDEERSNRPLMRYDERRDL